MPAKDIYHDTVRNALIKDGWTITDDPLRLSIDDKNLFIDLGAERIIAAEKGTKYHAPQLRGGLKVKFIAYLLAYLRQLLPKNTPRIYGALY